MGLVDIHQGVGQQKHLGTVNSKCPFCCWMTKPRRSAAISDVGGPMSWDLMQVGEKCSGVVAYVVTPTLEQARFTA